MLLNAYSVYDNKALAYAPPFFAVTYGSAVRSFGDLANDLQTSVGNHPGDFSLFCVGVYDDQHGALQPVHPVRHVVDASSVVRHQSPLPFSDTAVGETTPDYHRVMETAFDKNGRAV